jgi:hypothetical protein
MAYSYDGYRSWLNQQMLPDVATRMAPSPTSHIMALVTALALGLPQEWRCAAHAICLAWGEGPRAQVVDHEAGVDAADGVANSAATRHKTSCCHHQRMGQAPLARTALSDIRKPAASEADTLQPACDTSFPQSGPPNCCCLRAPSLVAPLPHGENLNDVELAEVTATLVPQAPRLPGHNVASDSNRSVPTARHILFCIWRC